MLSVHILIVTQTELVLAVYQQILIMQQKHVFLMAKVRSKNKYADTQAKQTILEGYCVEDGECNTNYGEVCIDQKCGCPENYVIIDSVCIPTSKL